jgi:hypothetical protein
LLSHWRKCQLGVGKAVKVTCFCRIFIVASIIDIAVRAMMQQEEHSNPSFGKVQVEVPVPGAGTGISFFF